MASERHMDGSYTRRRRRRMGVCGAGEALVAAATGGSTQFFLGTDSAPHAKGAKENACGCAGCFSAHAALPLYAHVFEEVGPCDPLFCHSTENPSLIIVHERQGSRL